jgi:low affinity Fe/Cu permease
MRRKKKAVIPVTGSPSTDHGFTRFARWSARSAGRPASFLVAVLVILGWAATGPVFHYSDTWQLVINTGTTIVTFLMVFVIQNTQNRDSVAMQLKLDEIIRAIHGAHNAVVNIEDLSEEELDRLKKLYEQLARQVRHAKAHTKQDVGCPELKER